MKNRASLRKVVNLSARAQDEHISKQIIELQEDTVIAALNILKREPGVLLADEVGMGKTFQSLAIIACLLHKDKKARALVVSPTRELCEQWFATAKRFGSHGFAKFPKNILGTARTLEELPDACKRHNVVFVSVNIFSGSRAKDERGFLLSIWAKSRKITPRKLSQIKKRIIDTGLKIGNAKTFMGHQDPKVSKKRLSAAFKRARNEKRGFLGLDDLYAAGIDAFGHRTNVRRALDRARLHMVGSLLKPFDLLVVDEAHKFKDAATVRAQAVTHVLYRNYHRAAFLTATPFQLQLSEMRQIFALFDGALSSPERFNDDVEQLLSSVQNYQRAYDNFEASWRLATVDQAEAFARWSEKISVTAEHPSPVRGTDDPNVAYLAEQAWALLRAKREKVEPAFRQWCLRSLKPQRRERRDVKEWLLSGDDSALVPLILHQRLRWEEAQRARGGRALPPDLSASSSYPAMLQSRLLKNKSRDTQTARYQRLTLQAIKNTSQGHPKISAVVEEVLDATDAGLKTLIFCERNATIKELQRTLEEGWMERVHHQWTRVCPGHTFEQIFGGDKRGVRQKIPPRFYRGSDELSVALTESIPYALFSTRGSHSELPRSFWQASGNIMQEANAILQRCQVPLQSAIRADYALASRCIDQAVVKWNLARDKNLRFLGPGDHALLKEILEKNYPQENFAPLRPRRQKEASKTSKPKWSISRAMFDAIISPRRTGIWIYYRPQLGRLSPVVRRMAVEAVRYFLTRREVPFLAEVLQRAGGANPESNELRNAIEVWWREETCVWRQKVGELLDYLPCLSEAEQQEVLLDMQRSPSLVQNSLAATSRILRQNTFNAPFYPMILIGNQTIQQGLDLHRQCRRVVHYDLRWNPSDLEQRIGRVERHGCLAERYPADHDEGKIQVIFPLLRQSADPSLYQDVRLRERWMDFLLGQPPTTLAGDAQSDPVIPLPTSLVAALKIELGPKRSD